MFLLRQKHNKARLAADLAEATAQSFRESSAFSPTDLSPTTAQMSHISQSEFMKSPPAASPSPPVGRVIESESLPPIDESVEAAAKEQVYEPEPAEPEPDMKKCVPESKWEPDGPYLGARPCGVCGESIGWLKQHHCRLCGFLIHAGCGTKEGRCKNKSGEVETQQRICNTCSLD